MPATLTHVATALRATLTTDADRLARDTGFVRRRRKITGPAFAQALVLGWLEDPGASVEELAGRLDAAVSPQALSQRLDATAADYLRELLRAAVGRLVAARPARVPLLDRFAGVYVEDATVTPLPDDLAPAWPGCGGAKPTEGLAALKLSVRWELTSGRLTAMAVHPGRVPDRSAVPAGDPLPAGSLRLADLGYFDLDRLRADSARGVYWISRLPPHVLIGVGDDIPYEAAALLGRARLDRLDIPVVIGGAAPLPCRLLALRCPAPVARLRRDRLVRRLREKGRPVSDRLLVLCEWTVFVTNLPLAGYEAADVWALYRTRWQVELLFKLWKSHGGYGHSRGRSGPRVLCELYAKLLAMVVHHWVRLLNGGPLWSANTAGVVRHIRRVAVELAAVLRSPRQLVRVLRRSRSQLGRLRPRRPRKRQPSTLQLLTNPKLCGLT
jgi:hypothetical protein